MATVTITITDTAEGVEFVARTDPQFDPLDAPTTAQLMCVLIKKSLDELLVGEKEDASVPEMQVED